MPTIFEERSAKIMSDIAMEPVTAEITTSLDDKLAGDMANAFKPFANLKRMMYRRKMAKAVRALKDAMLWCENEHEHGLMMALTEVKTLAAA